MNKADLVSRGSSGCRGESEQLAERPASEQSRYADDAIYAARLVDDAFIVFTREAQRIGTERMRLTG